MRNKQKGSVLVEFALVFPLIVAFIFGGFDLIWAEIQYAHINFLAEQTVVCMETHGCDPNAYMTNNTHVLGLTPSQLTYTITIDSVTIVYHYDPLIGLSFPRFTMTAIANEPVGEN